MIKSHHIISEQIKPDELLIILKELDRALSQNVSGDVVELGCYEGTSALFLQQLLTLRSSDKKLYLYDSFEGLPDKTTPDHSAAGQAFRRGELKASRARLLKNFVKADLPMPEVVRAWFYELDPKDLPDKIALAFLDGDFYESIMDSLKLVWPKMTAGSVILVDDYQNVALPGAAKAVDEWLANHSAKLTIASSLAVIHPLAVE